MAVKSGRFAFPDEPPKPSSGDGAGVESAYDPSTGARLAGYRAPTPSDRMDTSGGLDSHLSRSRGSERDYREAAAASSGIHPDGGGAGLGIPTGLDGFHTTGGNFVNNSDTGSGYGIAGTDPFVQRNEGGIGPDSDSNETAAGRPIA